MCDRLVCFHDLLYEQNDPANQRSHKATLLEKSHYFPRGSLLDLKLCFEKERNPVGAILQNHKGSNVRHKDMLSLVQGKSCFFCDLMTSNPCHALQYFLLFCKLTLTFKPVLSGKDSLRLSHCYIPISYLQVRAK